MVSESDATKGQRRQGTNVGNGTIFSEGRDGVSKNGGGEEVGVKRGEMGGEEAGGANGRNESKSARKRLRRKTGLN